MTDSNVVDFPSPKRPTREERAMQARLDRAERVSRLREVLGQNPKMGGEDQIIVARALYDLLERIGIPKRKVLDEAHIGSLGDSTKHLSQYAMPRGLSPEEIKRRRLNKKTGKYKEIAEAAAKLAGLDEADTLLEVFGQATFWQRESVREARPEFEELASRLHFVADQISTKYKLTEFFRDVERAGVSPGPTPECWEKEHLFGEEVAIEYRFQGEIGDAYSLGWPIELNQFTWPGSFEKDFDDFLVYPAIVLGAWRLGNPFPIRIVRPVSEVKTPVSAQGWPAVVLRLCIAPIGKQRSATPVLRVDLRAYIEVIGEFLKVVGEFIVKSGRAADWVELRPGKVTAANLNPVGTRHYSHVELPPGKVTVANYELNIERVPKLLWPFAPSHIEQHASMGRSPDDILFLPINAAVCEDWFSFPAIENLYVARERSSLGDRALGYSLCEDFELAVPFSELGCDTLAGFVDAVLCNPTVGLDRLLEQQVKRLKDAFEASRKAARDLRDRNWEAVKKRWETDENS